MKKIIFVFTFSFIFCTAVFAQGQLTLTTYYPAPFGMYEDLRVMGGDIGIGTTDTKARLDVRDGPGFSPAASEPTAFIGTATANKTALVAFSRSAQSASPPNIGNAAIYANATDWGIYSADGYNYFKDKVGIATTNPFSTFHVASVPGDTYSAIIEQQSAGGSKYALLLFKEHMPQSPATEGALYIRANNGYGIRQEGDVPNYFAGRVGIGFSSPAAKLMVDEDSYAYAAVFSKQAAATDGPVIQVFNENLGYSATELTGILIDGKAGAGGIFVNAPGKNYFKGTVGIGTSTPFSAPLNVVTQASNTYGAIFHEPATGNTKYALMVHKGFGSSPATEGALYLTSSSGYGIFQSGSVKNYFDGDIGIGVTTPQARLDVAGGVKVSAVNQACTANLVGTIRYDGPPANGFAGCKYNNLNGLYQWVPLD